jgi:hypothetical protein
MDSDIRVHGTQIKKLEVFDDMLIDLIQFINNLKYT